MPKCEGQTTLSCFGAKTDRWHGHASRVSVLYRELKLVTSVAGVAEELDDSADVERCNTRSTLLQLGGRVEREKNRKYAQLSVMRALAGVRE